MGDVTVAWFGALAFFGAALVVFGIFARRGVAIALGASLLVSLAGSWIMGPQGLLFGILVLPGVWVGRRRPRPPGP